MKALLLFFTILGGCLAQLPQVPATPIPIIDDSSPGVDPGTIDATTVVIRLAQLGYINILAEITTITGVGYASPLIQSYSVYSGLHSYPIGACQTSCGLSASDIYAQATTQHFGLTTNSLASQYPSAVTTYRQALASSSGGVHIVVHGPLSSLSALLQSPPDGISSLTGVQLVAAKVEKLVVMGGLFPMSVTPEYNLAQDPAAANYVVTNWPTPIYFSGFEVGNTVIAGAGIYSLPNTSMLKYAHMVFGLEMRQAWDECAVLYTAVGNNGYFVDSGDGTVTIDASTGNNSWAATPHAGQHYLIKSRSDADWVTYVNSVLVLDTVAHTNVRGGSVVRNGVALR